MTSDDDLQLHLDRFCRIKRRQKFLDKKAWNTPFDVLEMDYNERMLERTCEYLGPVISEYVLERIGQ